MQADWDQTRASAVAAVQPVRTRSPTHAVPRFVHDAIQAAGEPLTPADRAQWESRLGHDLSRVRVHSDEPARRAADAVGASAFAVGRHLVFGAGESATSDGGRLLGHELVHAVQQRLADVPNHGLALGSVDSPAEKTARGLAADGARPNGRASSPHVARAQMSAMSPLVQRQERRTGQGGAPPTTKKVQKPIKIEHKVPAAELKKHAAAAATRPASSGPAPKGPAGAPAHRPSPAPQRAPATPPQQAPATAPPQQAPQTPPVSAPSKPEPPSTTTGTKPPQTQSPATPTATAGTSPEHERRFFTGGKGFGLDLQFQPQENLGARDRFDPQQPDTPLSSPQWRGGPILTAGDVQLPINVILLDRELRIFGGETLNVGFEPQLIITPLGFSPHQEGLHYQPAIAAGLDLLHWKITDDLDWHIIQGQGLIQGDIPLAGKEGSLLGGGFQTGTGVELAVPHPGRPDERFTVGASLNGQALWTSDGNFSYTIVGSIFFTWHIRHH